MTKYYLLFLKKVLLLPAGELPTEWSAADSTANMHHGAESLNMSRLALEPELNLVTSRLFWQSLAPTRTPADNLHLVFRQQFLRRSPAVSVLPRLYHSIIRLFT